jgi:hypothetical protein
MSPHHVGGGAVCFVGGRLFTNAVRHTDHHTCQAPHGAAKHRKARQKNARRRTEPYEYHTSTTRGPNHVPASPVKALKPSPHPSN